MKVSVGLAIVAIVIAAVALYFSMSGTNTPETASQEDLAPTVVDSSASPLSSEEYHAAQDAFLVENLKKEGWAQTPEGLQYFIEKNAGDDAPKPEPGSRVTVHYEGSLTNGSIFDSSYLRGEPSTFPLSAVIEGWQIGVPMMRQNEIWHFAIPSELAYGERDSGPIPAGSTLLFKIELLNVESPAT